MNAITPFVFESEHMIRAIDRDGAPWFVLADVCRALDLSNPSMAAAPLDDDEKAKLNLGFGARGSDATVISESGLYALVLRCRGAMTPGTLPHRFRRWVTGEVLPTLRKTGRYDMGGAASPSPDAVAADMLPRVSLVRECRLLHGKAAAQALWRDLGLPEAPDAPPVPRPPGLAADLETYGVERFLEARTVQDDTARVGAEALYRAYTGWCQGEPGVTAATWTRFGRLMVAIGIPKEKRGRVVYVGVRLK